MTKRHKERLLKLADFLETVPKKNFNLETFAESDKDESINSFIKRFRKKECGTTGCALGWCTVVFPRKFKFEHNFCNSDCDIGLNMGWETADEFFGLRRIESEYLFMKDKYPLNKRTPKCVSKRIRKFVETGCFEYRFYYEN